MSARRTSRAILVRRRVGIRALRRWIERLRDVPAVVWGDFVLDEYWQCRSTRVSREAPVLILDYRTRSAQGGGGANAALNMASLGARVAVVGWVGDDAAGREIRALLLDAGCDVGGLLIHPEAPTLVKTRIVAGDAHASLQQVVRVDRGAAFHCGAVQRRALASALRTAGRKAAALVMSDYGYDSVTPGLWRTALKSFRRDVVVGVDTRYRLAGYRGVTVATPNEGEAAAAIGHPIGTDAELARGAAALRRRSGVEHLVITRGRDGLTLWNDEGGASLAAWGGKEAVDVTGAGDAVVATVTLALAAGAPPLEAAALANVAGSVAVSRRGAVAVSRAELRDALDSAGG